MKGIAQIFLQHGGLILPAKTPYERELLFEHVAQYANRHGRIRVLFDHRREWTVSVADEHTQVCTVCREAPDKLTYAHGDSTLCLPCARRELR